MNTGTPGLDIIDRQPKSLPAVPTNQDRICLALSGGGFRALLFHLGALMRLNEIGYLSKLQRIVSVSGGSIAAAYLA